MDLYYHKIITKLGEIRSDDRSWDDECEIRSDARSWDNECEIRSGTRSWDDECEIRSDARSWDEKIIKSVVLIKHGLQWSP